MSDLDIRTKNILRAVEATLTHTKATLSPDTHEAMVECLSRAMTAVKSSYALMTEGKASPQQYGKVLIKLAELTIMAVRKLPG